MIYLILWTSSIRIWEDQLGEYACWRQGLEDYR